MCNRVSQRLWPYGAEAVEEVGKILWWATLSPPPITLALAPTPTPTLTLTPTPTLTTGKRLPSKMLVDNVSALLTLTRPTNH